MNQEETIALFEQGREKWNAWAEGMLAKKRALEEKGLWLEDNLKKSEWRKDATADFYNATLSKNASPSKNFLGFIFPGDADFSNATFIGVADFSNATFTGDADFFDATFTGVAFFCSAIFTNDADFFDATFTDFAEFSSATFTGNANFSRATFKKDALFSKAEFNNAAKFRLCTFEGLLTNFENACFHQADFNAINVVRAFDLCGARFDFLPDFIQAHFSEAPRLDDVLIRDGDTSNGDTMPLKALCPPRQIEAVIKDKTPCAKWRALRRLAVQGHDHENERTFLAREIRARRGVEDKSWSAAWLFGWLYELLSDFGGSIGKPLLWLLGSTLLFALTYLVINLNACSCFLNPWNALTSDSVTKALETSLNGLAKITVFDGTFSSDNGVQSLQKIFNAALLFFFFLALRNRFKVK